MGIISSFKQKKPKVFSFSDLVHDFIPYACHVDHETIITKNGELLQTLKIVGLSQDKIGKDSSDLREVIRKAIIENVKSADFSFWIHTVRRKANLDPSPHYDSVFARDVHESWCMKNFWREKFINELYITVLYKGKYFNINNASSLLKSLSFIQQTKSHSKYLDESLVKLYGLTDAILKSLSIYGAVRLKMVEHGLSYKCQLVEFFSKIIHLHQGQIIAPIKDISEVLASGKVAFGNNTFQVLHQNKKHFGAMFSIKEYHDFSSNLINQLLKTPQEYVVTQTLTFTSNKEALKYLENPDYITKLSKDEEYREKSGLNKMLSNLKNNPTDFCKQQMTLMIFAEDQETLAQSISKMYSSISRLGITVVREDLLSETLYWAQLPGNFNYIKRSTLISTNNIAGYASLHNAPAGSVSSVWGAPITLFRRSDSTPYFFNFHVEKSGHTIIVGDQKSAKDVLFNFLITESSKNLSKLLAICGDKSSQITIKALGGRYCNLDLNSKFFNPLLLDDNASNRDFLQHWLSLILGLVENDENHAKVKQLIDAMYQLDIKQRNLNNFSSFCSDPELIEKVSIWQNGGRYANFFTNETDFFNLPQSTVTGFDFVALFAEGKPIYMPALMYIVYRNNLSFDGHPGIFAMTNCHDILSANEFISQLPELLDFMTIKNIVAIFTAQAENFDKYNIDAKLSDKIVTKIFMPDKDLCAKYQAKLKLTDRLIEAVKDMKLIYRHFMILQGDEATICEINLDGIDYAIAALSGKEASINAMNKAIAATSDNPKDWLHTFYEKVV